ncbi:MAG: hypothetical protein WBZ50_11175, partial [Nitrososphaeraceae archaeon]
NLDRPLYSWSGKRERDTTSIHILAQQAIPHDGWTKYGIFPSEHYLFSTSRCLHQLSMIMAKFSREDCLLKLSAGSIY